jgi:phosphoribosyl-AMP cyclohydrolase / phosphoribosyl-ATP pyrophosphohydrolase
MSIEIDSLDWNKQDGLLPAIVQDSRTLQVLMLGFMNRESLAETLDSKRVVFYSRSKQRLWMKGESSGHVLEVVHVQADCDADTILVTAKPHGPTCHRGTQSCFDDAPSNFVAALDLLVAQRKAERPEGSYTTKLFDAGICRIAQKVGEEGVETSLAAVAQENPDLVGEAADLVYHLIVLMQAKGMSWRDIEAKLQERHR